MRECAPAASAGYDHAKLETVRNKGRHKDVCALLENLSTVFWCWYGHTLGTV
jgi:hypothetical protein